MDVEGLNLTDYYDLIKYPMDLSTVENKLLENKYKTLEDALNEV